MYRALVIFPKSADPAEVDALIDGIASSFEASAGDVPMTRSVGSLMGPGAQGGEDFQDVKAGVETLTSSIFLFEFQEV